MKAFTPAQEQALRALLLELLIECGYAPRSTKQSSRRSAAPAPTPATPPSPTARPADEDVLFDAERVCTILKTARRRVSNLLAADRRLPASERRLPEVGGGRRLLFRPKDVYAYAEYRAGVN